MKKVEPYIHTVKYYETDRMGVTHHSNYIRFMEEGRVDFMDKIGFSYKEMEEGGVISPIISAECKYIKSTTFEDEIEIETVLTELRPVKATFKYTMKNRNTGEVVATGQTVSGFISEDGKPMLANKAYPEFYNRMAEYAETVR